ncbi:hypothetical protein [Aquipseudomonas campi]
MAEPAWKPKLDRDGRVIPDCWADADGFTVAICRLPEKRFVVTRPGGVMPFAYLGNRDEVIRVIEQAKAGLA